MTTVKRIAFDMAAFMWRALHAGKDKENGYEVPFGEAGETVYINTAQYGYDLVLGMMLDAMKWDGGFVPHQAILVFEGMHSKRLRLAIDPAYKANRDARPPQQYEEYAKLQQMLETTWRNLGAIAMSQDYVEGDDVLGYLAKNVESPLLIATYDGDMTVLNGTNTYGADIDVWINGVVGENKYGPFDYRLVTLYKALVGDFDDGIRGCEGFGEKAWLKLLDTYGEDGLFQLAQRLDEGKLGDIHEQRDEDKLLAKICDQEAQIIRCYKLAKLHPEWVNTRDRILDVRPGMVKPVWQDLDERLHVFAAKNRLVTADNFDEVAAFCVKHFEHSPFVALDIETSTPPESDEWLAAQTPPDPDGVDVLGSKLTGLSLTFGRNLHYTVYISVDHAETNNVNSERVRQLVAKIPKGKHIVIQNVQFELPVLYNEWGEQQEDNGYEGFLPNVLDTKFEANYVDENRETGLKERSLHHLGYQQQTFHETVRFTGEPDQLRPGGRLIEVVKPRKYYVGGEEVTEAKALALLEKKPDADVGYDETVVTRQYKMCELPATHVFGYGCDDTVCTAALHNFYRLMMELDHHWQVYLDVEIDAAYMSAAGFIQGTDFSPKRMRELMAEDDETYAKAWETLRNYLLSKGWSGSICPTFGPLSTPAEWKVAFEIVAGHEIETAVRKPERMAEAFREAGQEVLAELLQHACFGGDWGKFNSYVKSKFSGEPVFNIDSPKQKELLMYGEGFLSLPVVWRNAPTEKMRSAGIREGNVRTDVSSIDWALKFDAKDRPEAAPVLTALKLMMMVGTRRKLYYEKYMGFLHWKTGKLHSQFKQCHANTRRSADAKPNKQQWPKHPKIEGQPAKFRETIVPHHKDAVIVSLDEVAQELRIIADESQDPNMLACYVGDNKKDMHSLTGLGIAKRRYKELDWSYEVFVEAVSDKSHELYKRAKECRALGKKVNFTTEYGAMEDKVAETLTESVEDSRSFMEAKEEMFSVAAEWKQNVIAEARRFGLVRTKAGAVRHLRELLNSKNSYEASKADRQAVNFKIQGSAAEQTKLAYGEAWRRRLVFKYDCVFIGPVHDEVVWSVSVKDLLPFLQEMHACMVRPYANMQVPIESSISFGPNFGEQIEVGDKPTPEAVIEGLALMPLDCRSVDAANADSWAEQAGVLDQVRQRREAIKAEREKRKAA